MRRLATTLLLALLAIAMGTGQARAQTFSCSVSAPALAFGTVNVLSGSPSYASDTATLSCASTYPSAITGYACLYIGTGSGGGSTTARTLSSGAGTLPFEIRQTPASPTEIGDGTANLPEGPLLVAVPANGSASLAFAITGIIRPQAALPLPGTYSSLFSGTQFEVKGSTTASTTCAQVAATVAGTYTGSLAANATIATQCTVGATSMPFPTASFLTAALQATATVTVTCNAAASAVVALDNGAFGTGPTTRQMGSGTNRVTYGIYRDSARTAPWGATMGSNTATAAVTGASSAALTAYGLVPPQAGKPPGVYTDVVNVTVTY